MSLSFITYGLNKNVGMQKIKSIERLVQQFMSTELGPYFQYIRESSTIFSDRFNTSELHLICTNAIFGE